MAESLWPGFKARTSWIRDGVGFWEMMSDGEMDVSSASVCVFWCGLNRCSG